MENDSFANYLKIKDSQNISEGVINELVKDEKIIILLQLDPRLPQDLYALARQRKEVFCSFKKHSNTRTNGDC